MTEIILLLLVLIVVIIVIYYTKNNTIRLVVGLGAIIVMCAVLYSMSTDTSLSTSSP